MKKVPRGKVTTYKKIGEKLGTKAYRAIGQSLRRNPYAPKVPCHRVIRSDFSIGGFRGKIKGKFVNEKIELLRKEGIKVEKGKIKKKFILSSFS